MNLNSNVSLERTRYDLEDCFRKWGMEEYRFPRMEKGETGPASVIFYVNDERQEVKCARFVYYRDNLRALFLALDSLRKAHDRGILEEYARAAIAFLPAPQTGPTKRPWYEVLQVSPTADPDVVNASYRALAKQHHTDTGNGNNPAMVELNEAKEDFERSRR